MPPRPPLTSLVIHTWKEHGKPRPLSNQDVSVASVRARISRSISHEAQLAAIRKGEEDVAPCNHREAVIRSKSVEEGLIAELRTKNITLSAVCSPVLCTPLQSDDEGTCSDSGSWAGSHEVTVLPTIPDDCALEGLSLHKTGIVVGRTERFGKPPRLEAVRRLKLRQRRLRARTHANGTVFESSFLDGGRIAQSSSYDAGLSAIARNGVVQCGVSPNV